MSIRMVVTDLDGTLLKDDKTVSRRTADTIAAMRGRGVLFVIATARPIRAVRRFLPFLEYDAAIFHNGAVVVNGGERMSGFGIDGPFALVSNIIGKRPGSRISVESNDVMFSNYPAEETWPGVEYSRTADFHEIRDFVADKIIIELSSPREMDELAPLIPEGMYVQLSENRVAMIMNRAATKTNGVRMIAAHYGISMEETAAFGDDRNDVDMLKNCGTGIAMANALDEVKSAADAVCAGNDYAGVAEWIEQNILA